jgi:hypothetical protein
VPSVTICAIVMIAVTVRIVATNANGRCLQRSAASPAGHADDVVAAERENQEERRR